MKVTLDTRPDALSEGWRLVDKVRGGTTTVKLPIDLVKSLLLDHSRLVGALASGDITYSQEEP